MTELSQEGVKNLKFILSRLGDLFFVFVAVGVIFHRLHNPYVNVGLVALLVYFSYRLYKRYRRRCPNCVNRSLIHRCFLSIFVRREPEREVPPFGVRDPNAWLCTVKCHCPICGYTFFEKAEVKSFEHRFALFKNW